MFLVADGGPTPDYIVNLYAQLPVSHKRLVRLEGSVYWMLSHPRQAAAMIGDWFTTSLPAP